MNMIAIAQNEAITWGDIIVVLLVLVLIGLCLTLWRRR